MSRFMWLSLVLFTARIAAADSLVDAATDRKDVIGARAQLGLAEAPFDAMTLAAAKGQAFIFTVEGSHPLGSNFAIGIRAPLVIASVSQPAGSYVDDTTFANPQLRGAYRLTNAAGITIIGGLDIGAPLASHSTTLMPNRALAIANGVEGLGDPDLFTPGVVPFTPFASMQWSSAPWSVDVMIRLPFLLRVSDADMSRTNAIGFASVLDIEGRRGLTRRLALAAATRLAVEVQPAVDHVGSVARLQDLERLSLGIGINEHAILNVELQAAVGGELAGSMVGLGVRSVVTLP